jgi:uncharacterized protein (DUF302 family)
MNHGEGVISKRSPFSVAATLDRVEGFLKQKNVQVFARVDHSGEAERVGLQMNPTQLLIFGNPRAGTPIMIAAPTSAIELPLKALAWQDNSGAVWLSWNDPEYIRRRFGLAEDQIQPIAGIGKLLESALG